MDGVWFSALEHVTVVIFPLSLFPMVVSGIRYWPEYNCSPPPKSEILFPKGVRFASHRSAITDEISEGSSFSFFCPSFLPPSLPPTLLSCRSYTESLSPSFSQTQAPSLSGNAVGRLIANYWTHHTLSSGPMTLHGSDQVRLTTTQYCLCVLYIWGNWGVEGLPLPSGYRLSGGGALTPRLSTPEPVLPSLWYPISSTEMHTVRTERAGHRDRRVSWGPCLDHFKVTSFREERILHKCPSIQDPSCPLGGESLRN